MRAPWVCALLLLPALSHAIEFEAKSTAKVTYEGTVAVVDLESGRYYLNEVPPAAQSIEQFEQLPKKYQSKATLALTMGDELGLEEVQAVLDAWYHDTAIEYASLKIRELTVGSRRYVAACIEQTMFGCVNGSVFAGTVVTYQVNGANRSGGMTGFQPRTVVIRKEPASPAP